MTEKLADLNREARKVRMKINQARMKAMRINNTKTFTLGGKEIGNVDIFPLS